MKRRNFVKGLTGLAAVVAAPRITYAEWPDSWERAAQWKKVADETNTFGPNDTLDTRLEKFNELTGMELRLLGPSPKGLYCLVYTDNKYTGYMDRETLMHWTAQVGLGYRLAKAQRS